MKRLLILLSLGLAACSGGVDVSNGNGGTTHTVRRGPLRITLSEKGTLRAKNSVKIRSKLRSQAKVLWLVEQGTQVKEGDVLIELDKTGHLKDLDSLTDQVTQLEADVKSAKTDEEIQESDNLNSIQKAELDLDFARQELERYLEGDAKQDKRSKLLKVEIAESDLQRAREKAERTPELLKEGFITKLEAEEEAFRISKLARDLETARLDLKLWEEYTFPMESKRKKSKVEEARRDLTRAKKLAESRLAAKAVVRRQRERRLSKAKLKLEATKEQLEHMTLKAPGPGIVVFERGRRWDSEEIKVGDTAYPGRVLMTLPDLSEVEVELQIHEADITKVAVGQSVTVTLDIYKELGLSGKVERIATVGSSRGWRDDTKKFGVTVSISEKDLNLKPGISAKVEIQVDRLENVLSLPIQAIFAADGKTFCYVVDGGDPERRFITAGKSNETFVEITEGLSEGDVVLLYDPQQQEEADEEAENGEAK